MPLAKDLLHPSIEEEKGKCKLKRLVQSPNSYFMDVKCPGCYKITTVFSHAQTVVVCAGCSTVLCQPTGGKARYYGASHRIDLPIAVFIRQRLHALNRSAISVYTRVINLFPADWRKDVRSERRLIERFDDEDGILRGGEPEEGWKKNLRGFLCILNFMKITMKWFFVVVFCICQIC